MTQRSFPKTLRDLALALLNATVMLVIIALICATFMLRELNELRDSAAEIARTALAPQSERLNQIRDRADRLEARLAAADTVEMIEIRDEVRALREALPELSDVAELSTRAFADQLLNSLAARLQSVTGNHL
ncbi:hypothetical protein ROA7450_01194 [Roseovarius albus]|uniref:Uncharacterized protein n=2 Tax=Roseovarius albus TaxID=1247867 RepID=A0A1X6YR56_9RHOB|nr:hypothetical protein ROA7450_01194 [Roseovarius albus]